MQRLLPFSLVFITILSLLCAPLTGAQDERGIGLGRPTKLPGVPEKMTGEQVQPELIVQTGFANFSGSAKVEFSPDGRLLAVSLQNGIVKLWEVGTGRELRSLGRASSGDSNSAQPIAFSPDTHYLAVGGSDAVIRVWDVLTGRQVREIPPEAGRPTFLQPVRFIAFKPDGRTLISVTDRVRAWDVISGRDIDSFKLPAATRPVESAPLNGSETYALSPDGTQLLKIISVPGAGMKRQGVAQVNDPAKWGEDEFVGEVRASVSKESAGAISRRWELPGVESYAGLDACAASFTSAGSAFVAGVDGKKLKLWDVTAGTKPQLLVGRLDEPAALSFSSSGRLVVALTSTGVRVWDTATGREKTALKIPLEGTAARQTIPPAVAISRDERFLATTRGDSALILWDVATKSIARRIVGTGNLAYAVSFSADGKQLSAGGHTSWDLSQGVGIRLAAGAETSYLRMPGSQGHKLAAANPANNSVSIFDAQSGLQTHKLAAPTGAGSVRNILFDPGGKILAAIYSSGVEEMRGQSSRSEAGDHYPKDVEETASGTSRARVKSLNKHLSRSGNRVTDSIRNYVRLWDAETGNELRTFLCQQGAEAAGFSGDGRLLATSSRSGDVTLREVASGRVLHSLSHNAKHDGAVMTGSDDATRSSNISDQFRDSVAAASLAFSPDGKVLATGFATTRSNDDANDTTAKITLWDTATGKSIGQSFGHGAAPGQLAFSADGKLLASNGADQTILIWEVATRTEVLRLTSRQADINSLAFSPDAKLLASAGDDGSTYLWDVNSGAHLATLVSMFDGGEWLVITPDGLFDGTPASLNQILWRYDEDTFNVAPVEWFFNEYYQPGLLADLVAGKRPQAKQSFAQKERRQPRVTVSLGSGQDPALKFNERTATIRIQVAEELPDQTVKRGSGAQDLRLFRNGSLVRYWRGDLLGGRPDAVFETNVTLVAGDNNFVAYAFNRDNVKSLDARLSIKGDESLRRGGVAYVLGVGINEYENPQYNLKYAVPDARIFTDELSNQQNRLRLYERMEVITLYDRKATKQNILQALSELAAKVQPEDGVAIYFAGHGTAQGNQFYIVPHDLGYDGERGKLGQDGLRTLLAHSISDKELEGAFEKINAGRLVFVLDACNSGQVLEAEDERRGPMNSKGLAQLAYDKGMYVLAASQSYQAAQEVEQFGHGLLTYALVEEGLKQRKADFKPSDGTITIREWFDHAAWRVPDIQVEKIKQIRASSSGLFNAEAARGILGMLRSGQRPRAFYRRELEAIPFIIAGK